MKIRLKINKFLLLLLIQAFIQPVIAQRTVYYGLSVGGGTNLLGTIISFDPSTNAESTVWSFGNGNDGAQPYADMVYDSSKNAFYGTTLNGGSGHAGTIFSFDPTTRTENVVWNFASGTDGVLPSGNLAYDPINGLYYLMTEGGGSLGDGAIISFNPATDRDSVLWSFGNGNDGWNPNGSLIYNADSGLFYGMTYSGGTHGLGTIISFNPVTNIENVVWNFSGSPGDGSNPKGNLTYIPRTHLYYGMTTVDGSHGGGVIFSFDPVNQTERILRGFGAGSDGQYPEGSLIYNSYDGLFYGTTSYGGANNIGGTIFTFDLSTNSERVIWSFGLGTDGSSPLGNLTYDTSTGLFYTLTAQGGTNDYGTIISFNPSTGADSVLWNFGNGSDGESPHGSLVSFYFPSCPSISVHTSYISGTSAYAIVSNGSPPYTYAWSTTPNQQTDTATGLTSGETYTVTVTDQNGCTGIDTISIPLGLSNLYFTSEISIYPNPTNGIINISGLSAGQIIEIYDYLGQKVSNTTTEDTTQKIDMSVLGNGIYLLQVVNKDGVVTTQRKVVK